MKNLTATICLAVALLIGSAGVSWSQDYQKGLAAYKSGDYATALRQWTPLAKQGNADAQNNLGVMYRHGMGVPQNDKTAVKWYRLAAEQGDADAQLNLGLMYQYGRGVPKNHKTAAKWYKLAAEQGDADAQSNLALMYKEGQGVIQDNVYAHMWWNIGAMTGSEMSTMFRDSVEEEMTSSQLAEARKLARECVRKNYKGC